MSLLTELHGDLLTESGLSLLAEQETESGSGGSGSSAFTLRGKAVLSLTTRAALSSVKVFTPLPLKAFQSLLYWISHCG